jgi:hypothetical protein
MGPTLRLRVVRLVGTHILAGWPASLFSPSTRLDSQDAGLGVELRKINELLAFDDFDFDFG